MHRSPELTEDYLSPDHPPRVTYQNAGHGRQPMYHPHTYLGAAYLGAAGHWIHLAGVAAPLVIAEVIKDPNARWKALRLVSVGAAIASEAVWTHRLIKEREKDEEARAALKSCSERGR